MVNRFWCVISTDFVRGSKLFVFRIFWFSCFAFGYGDQYLLFEVGVEFLRAYVWDLVIWYNLDLIEIITSKDVQPEQIA